jgi:hypothetical protein
MSMKFTNTQKGIRGLNTKSGPVMVNPGATVDVEMASAEIEVAKATGWFDIAGSAKAAKKDDDEPDVDDLRKQAEDLGIDVDKRWGVERLQSEIDKALDK